MTGLRVLITNQALRARTGTELYVLDLAKGLLGRGCRPVVYSPNPGAVADELRRATVPVVDRLERLRAAPDVIHGHHNHPTLAALSRFPGSPALLFCHDWDAWHDEPFDHPRVLRYVAVDEACHDRIVCLGGIDPARVTLAPNWADTSRFRPRGPLPERPAKALVFNNLTRLGGRGDPFRRACKPLGLTVEAAGQASGRTLVRPEETLARYDLVFAKGKCAFEALAVGAAVVLYGFDRLGPMVTADRLDALRRRNFGRRAIDTPLSERAVAERIACYDAADAAAVSDRVRAESDVRPVIDRLVGLYHQVVAEHRGGGAADPAAESLAVAEYLQRTQLMVEYGAKRWARKRREAELRASAADPLERLKRLFKRAA